MRTRRTLATGLLSAVAALLLVVMVASPAWGQDPYGGTSTTALPFSFGPTCGLSTTQASPGDTVTAAVHGVPSGMPVRVLFDGAEVASEPGPVAGEPSASGGVATVHSGFRVPRVAEGTYLVTAVGVDFTAVCEPSVDGFTVRGGSASSIGGGTSGSSGRLLWLPSTGASIVVAIALGLSLIVVGRTLLEPIRRIRSARP